jgi:hypothetical protein
MMRAQRERKRNSLPKDLAGFVMAVLDSELSAFQQVLLDAYERGEDITLTLRPDYRGKP